MKNKQSELLFYFTYINSPKFNITQQSVSALFMCAFIPMKQLISLMRLLKVHVFITEISCCVFGSKKILHTHIHTYTPATSAAESHCVITGHMRYRELGRL